MEAVHLDENTTNAVDNE